MEELKFVELLLLKAVKSPIGTEIKFRTTSDEYIGITIIKIN